MVRVIRQLVVRQTPVLKSERERFAGQGLNRGISDNPVRSSFGQSRFSEMMVFKMDVRFDWIRII